MTRTIEISTDVFAAIWAARIEGEESENDILQRVLQNPSSNISQVKKVAKSVLGAAKSGALKASGVSEIEGYYDSRNDVYFKNGFMAFRNYKGQAYHAVVMNGQWVRTDTLDFYISLNKLNESIASGTENIWNGNWKFEDEKGVAQSIDKLRQ